MGKKHGGAQVDDWDALRLLSRFRLGNTKQFAGKVSPREGSQHPVSDSVGQHLGPLVDGLVRDADCVCGGRHGSAEKFDGLGLEHDSLNHSSGCNATTVQLCPCTVSTMVEHGEFKDRLAWAMGGVITTQQVADACNVSYQAAAKWLKGTSKEMTATNLAATAKLLKVDPIWLALGEGEARPQPISIGSLNSMEAQMLTMYRQLPPNLQHEVDADINSKVVRGSAERSGANPFPRLASSAPPDPGPISTGGLGGTKGAGTKKKAKAKT